MAIKADKSKITLDFQCEVDVPELAGIATEGSKKIERYDIRFHNTEEYGNTISIKAEQDDSFLGYPADLLLEVVDFLKGRGYLTSNEGSPRDIYPIDKKLSIQKYGEIELPEIYQSSASSEKEKQQLSDYVDKINTAGPGFEGFTNTISDSQNVNELEIPAIEESADMPILDNENEDLSLVKEMEELKNRPKPKLAGKSIKRI
ncbi:MAG: hypothetical protein WDA06_00050 [Phenylobacterium sp.]